MNVAISASRPTDAACLIFPIAKGSTVAPPIEAQALAAEAAAGPPFPGETGGLLGRFAAEGGGAGRGLLGGAGGGRRADIVKDGAAGPARRTAYLGGHAGVGAGGAAVAPPPPPSLRKSPSRRWRP